ncbi:prepilin peptidase CpaA [Rhodoblastus acidophilus]|uniref:A24 family peptidase n=1 Tax=Rhodoblastus acidophilus TaxID=1074 RepID=UPI002225A7B4|nr:prepilin peptidase [Rhodoblastus acidophilus]MCW2284688.1 prepilin peptidase CpaA [Rhodoblastus acidophilus]MCW2333641.1 prepilin peptidase CpaA [Rhodoblastus acidophilus]
MLDLPVLVVFPALMAYAAFSDLFTMTIANWISIVLVAAFVVLALFMGLPATTILLHLACGLAVLAITFVLFAFGQVGGGDAKFAATTAVWLGFEHLAEYGLIASLLGGVLTVGLLGFRKLPLPAWAQGRAWIDRLHDKKVGAPYGITLAITGILLYPDSLLFTQTLGA